jgi:uncharacterized repeat protein (TIGR03803 family)
VSRNILLLALLAMVMTTPVSGQYTLTTLASFNGTDGANPDAGLILSGNVLYGTTSAGGGHTWGDVFSLPVTGGTPNVLVSFDKKNGASPIADLILSGNTLYGTTEYGGAFDNGYQSGNGTVFSVPITGGSPTTLLSFDNSNGLFPEDLVLSGSTLYGTTLRGGVNGIGFLDGTLFSLPVNGGKPTVTAFNGVNGALPNGGLILSGNTLYGTARAGGQADGYGDGVVFSMPTAGGTPTVLATFNNGDEPQAGLILSAGILYGTTAFGGGDDSGDVFSVPVGGGTPTVLAAFNGGDGEWPEAPLLLSGDTLYGTTFNGGAGGYGGVGEVFSVPITGGPITVLAQTWGDPSGLIMDANGDLFGTTEEGGDFGDGTVFELSPAALPEPSSMLMICVVSGTAAMRRKSYAKWGAVVRGDGFRGRVSVCAYPSNPLEISAMPLTTLAASAACSVY